jgi:hypothetical protein
LKKQKFTSDRKEKKGMNGGGYFLPEASTDKVNSFNNVLSSLEIGHSSMQGYRPNMEDACIAVSLKDLPDHVCVSILDGHAGGGASEYISTRLPLVIAETTQYKEYLMLDVKMRAESDLLSAALVQAYINIDDEFYSYEHMVRIRQIITHNAIVIVLEKCFEIVFKSSATEISNVLHPIISGTSILVIGALVSR